MFVTFITLAVISFAIAGLRDLVRQDGAKIVAAMRGRSWAAEPKPGRPIVVRLSSTYKAEAPAWQPALRAAA
jgi:hypothetical protein